jgi:hypothetical protein
LYCAAFLIHMSGVRHGSLHRRNITKGPRGIRIIDFSSSQRDHHCVAFESKASECEELEEFRARLGLGRSTLENVFRVRMFDLLILTIFHLLKGPLTASMLAQGLRYFRKK